MSFICKNGSLHQHSTIYESKVCWGILPPPAATTPATASHAYARATERQLGYVRDLGGDAHYAAKLTIADCSKYIKRLETTGRGRASVSDPRLDMIKALMERVPDGYYAVQKESGAKINFLRISRPKPNARNRFAGALKIQTQHGPRLEEAAALWPSGKWSVWDHFVPDSLLLLVADHHSAGRRYAKEIGRCMRCNAELTDARSRHYGIGPECEQKSGWGWVIEELDEENGASFETLRARGLIDLSV